MLVVQEESLSDGTDADGQGEVSQTVLQVLTLQTCSQVRACVCACVCEKYKMASHQSEEKLCKSIIL